jgi:hypothetical protein
MTFPFKPAFLFLFLCCQGYFYAQEPGAHFDFGTYHKNPKVFNGKLQNPIKKLPKDRIWLERESSTGNAKSATIYHLSRDIYGDTTSVSENGEFIRFRNVPFPSEVKPYTVYSNYVTNNDWRYFVRYVQDSISRRILSLEYDPYLFCNPEADKYEQDIEEGNCNLNWKTPIIYDRNVTKNHSKYLAMMIYPMHERIDYKSERFEVDARKLVYRYTLIDYAQLKEKWKIKTSLDFDYLTKTNQTKEFFEFTMTQNVNIYRDSLLWIKDTSLYTMNNIEDGLVKHYNSNPYFKNFPVVGINEPIAAAYLHWLEKLHQKYLDKNKVPLVVKYVLPENTCDETLQNKEVIIESFSLSNWKVTNKDYKEFVDYVTDSIARYIIYEKYPDLMITCFDEYGEKKSIYESFINYDIKIDWKNKTFFPIQKEIAGKIETIKPPVGFLSGFYYNEVANDTNKINKRKLNYSFNQYDFKTASLDFKRNAVSEERTTEFFIQNDGSFCNHLRLIEPTITKDEGCFRGKQPYDRMRNLNLSYYNDNCRSTDLFSHYDRSLFIDRKLGTIYPSVNNTTFTYNCIKKGYCSEEVEAILATSEVTNEMYARYIDTVLCPCNYEDESVPKEYDFDTNPDALITAISYWQYEAYWNWKNKKRTVAFSDNPAINDYIPSREEFVKIQQGETVVHPKEVHALPSPVFRYEILFYPR